MKNKKKVYQVTATLLLAGCISGSTLAEDCVSASPLPKLWVDTGRLEFVDGNNGKKPICVSIPGEFDISIKQTGNATHTVGVGEARVTEKVEGGPEIRGDNDPVVNKITVSVTGDGFDVGDEFGFLIEVDGVGMLDPRVRVVDDDVLERLRWESIDEFLQTELGLTLYELRELKPPQD